MVKPETLWTQIRLALDETFGTRLRGVILYGSEARGSAGPDSDVDLLVLLDGPPCEPADSWAAIDALYPLSLEVGRPIHAEPVDVREYERQTFPLYRVARREGIPL